MMNLLFGPSISAPATPLAAHNSCAPQLAPPPPRPPWCRRSLLQRLDVAAERHAATVVAALHLDGDPRPDLAREAVDELLGRPHGPLIEAGDRVATRRPARCAGESGVVHHVQAQEGGPPPPPPPPRRARGTRARCSG